ncbi:MAG: hypothetical protein LBC98_06270 [Prevotellaceae bacterium]|jgi:TPR repeat protein|nr:hypothetical protein [Prevotellaceae bacterium]
MNFLERYQALLADKSADTGKLHQRASEILNQRDFSPCVWYESMALCETALDAGMSDEVFKSLFKEMFRHSRDHHSGMALDEADFAVWFDKGIRLCEKFIAIGHTGAWAEISDMYESARGKHRNLQLAKEALDKGVEAEDPVALSIYGYHLFYGINGIYKQDKTLGREYIIKGWEKGYEWGELYLILIDFESKIDNQTFIQRIESYIASCPDNLNKPWHLLGDAYYDRVGDFDTAMQIYKRGIAQNDPYCKYRTGMSILNSRIEGETEQAIRLLEEAYEYRILHAANFLGQYYYYNEAAYDVNKAIEWFLKAAEYHYSPAIFNLAILYLYDAKGHKNISEGMKYLDRSIEAGNPRAFSEKAYILMDSDEIEHNIPLAKELLEQAMELGDDYAPYRLARAYQNAEFNGETDLHKAIELYKIAADRAYSPAMEMLGRYYRTGFSDTEPDPQKAIEYYTAAMERGSDYARVEMAICYEEGFGVEIDDQRAFELLLDAADNDYVYANVKLGYYYMNGIVDEPDYERAFNHFSRAAEKENHDAIYNLGRMYKYALGRAENPSLALEYFKRAADAGDIDAFIELGLCYEQGYGGLDIDADQAIHYMSLAAEQNVHYAQYKLGCYYYYGLGEQDMERGLAYLHAAYDNGSPLAALIIGDHHLYARQEGLDFRESFRYYKFAEERGYLSEGLGLCYRYGVGTEENEAEAFKIFSIAANRGYTAAKYNLALCHKQGYGTPLSQSEAYLWMLQAAEEENRNAEYEVGVMLLEGNGVSRDTEAGIRWLKKAAESEQDDAQLKLGNCYLVGEGVPEDEIQAMYWFQKAAENGNEHALKITGKRSGRRR